MGWRGLILRMGQFGGCVVVGGGVFRGAGSLVTGIRYSLQSCLGRCCVGRLIS